MSGSCAEAAGPQREQASASEAADAGTNEGTGGYGCQSRLEGLPSELRDLLLDTLKLPELKTLVHSSPLFHRHYVVSRYNLLCRSLENTLGYSTGHAHALVLYKIAPTTEMAPLVVFEDCYSQSYTRFKALTQEEAISIAIYYRQYVMPVAEHFARWLLSHLAERTGNDKAGSFQDASVSHNEAARLMRSIYHFQLACELKQGNPHYFRDIEAYLEMLEPWEAEELLTFYTFVRGVYEKILKDIAEDLDPDDPTFDGQTWPPTPEGAHNFSRDCKFHSIHTRSGIDANMFSANVLIAAWDAYIDGTILQGLPLLTTVLSGNTNRDELVLLMQRNIKSAHVPFSTEASFGEAYQLDRHTGNLPHWKNRLQENRIPLPFRGDGRPDAPPLAWTTLWRDTYSYLCGTYISDGLRRWGYVFWDAARLRKTNALALLEEEECYKNDPRKGMNINPNI